MGQRRYSRRVIVTVYEEQEGEAESIEVVEQRWAKPPHLVVFHDLGPFALDRRAEQEITASVESSLVWLTEDLTDRDRGRML
jgi:hypothetical protein